MMGSTNGWSPAFTEEERRKMPTFLQTKVGEVFIEKIPPTVPDHYGEGTNETLITEFLLLEVVGSCGSFSTSSVYCKVIILKKGEFFQERQALLYFDWIYYLDKDDEGNPSYVSLMKVLEVDKPN